MHNGGAATFEGEHRYCLEDLQDSERAACHIRYHSLGSMDGGVVNGSTHYSRSPILNLDVGGKVFRTTKASVDRFPKSLLADLVKALPEAVGGEKPLFIDRNPKGFNIILEIHRSVSTSVPWQLAVNAGSCL